MSVLDDIGRAVSALRERDDKPSKVLMPKAVYDKLDPELIAEKEREFDCKIVPVEHKICKPTKKCRLFQSRPMDAMNNYKRNKRRKL